jgi:hypothetical protein
MISEMFSKFTVKLFCLVLGSKRGAQLGQALGDKVYDLSVRLESKGK